MCSLERAPIATDKLVPDLVARTREMKMIREELMMFPDLEKFVDVTLVIKFTATPPKDTNRVEIKLKNLIRTPYICPISLL